MVSKHINQHYIPQFLLKGFADPNRLPSCIVYVFPSARPPYSTSVRNVGSMRYFYGKDDKTGIESRLSELESRAAEIIERLRLDNTSGVTAVAPGLEPILSAFMWLSAVRSRHFRDGFIDTTETLTATVAELMSQPGSDRSLLRRGLEQSDTDWDNQVERCFLEAKVPEGHWLRRLPRENLKQLISSAYDSLPSGKRLLQFGIRQLNERLRSLDLETLATDAHQSSLRKILHGEGTPRFDGLKWSCVRVPSDILVLGDCGPLVFTKEDNEWMLPINQAKLPGDVVLPLSSRCLLVGHQGEVPVLAFHDVSLELAKFSREFFVSHQRTDREDELHRVLGERKDLLSPEWIKAQLGEAFGDTLPSTQEKRGGLKVEKKPGRNDPCPCGSRRKFKKCCGKSS